MLSVNIKVGYRMKNKRLFEERIRPYYINGIAYFITWISLSMIIGGYLWFQINHISLYYTLIITSILLAWYYYKYIRVYLRVRQDVRRSDIKNDKIYIFEVINQDQYNYKKSTDVFSMFYSNPIVKRYKVKANSTTTDKIDNYYIYLSIQDKNKIVEENSYYISYLNSSKAIYIIKGDD